jgi:hypothetical protein
VLDAWPVLETLELEWGSRITLAQLLAAARTHSALRELLCTAVVRAGEPLPEARELVMRLAFDGEDTSANPLRLRTCSRRSSLA